MKQKIAIILLGFLCIILSIIIVIGVMRIDKEGPVIEYSEKTIVYTDGMEQSELLDDVSAIDKKDGDVKESIIIKEIVKLEGGKGAVIVYAAKDKTNNITIKERNVEMLTKNESEKNNAKGDKTKDKSTDKQQAEGEQQIDNQKEQEKANKEEALSQGIPYLKLTANEVKLKKGTTFNYANYVEEAVDDKDDAYRRIRMLGEYNTAVVGEYDLQFYIMDSDGNGSSKEKLKLIIEE